MKLEHPITIVLETGIVYPYLFQQHPEPSVFQRMVTVVQAAPDVGLSEIMEEILNGRESPAGAAVWDVVQTCYAEGEFQPGVLFRAHPTINAVRGVIERSKSFYRGYNAESFAKEMIETRDHRGPYKPMIF